MELITSPNRSFFVTWEAAFARRKRRKGAGAGSSTLFFDSIACTSAWGHGANTVAPRRSNRCDSPRTPTCTIGVGMRLHTWRLRFGGLPDQNRHWRWHSTSKSTHAICNGGGAAANGVGVSYFLSHSLRVAAFPSKRRDPCSETKGYAFLIRFFGRAREELFLRKSCLSHLYASSYCPIALPV